MPPLHMRRTEANGTESIWERYIGYDVVDVNDYHIGKLHCLWVNDAGEAIFLGVKTGWLALGPTHIVPADVAPVNEELEQITLPYDEYFVKEGPVYDARLEVDANTARQFFSYYGKEPRAPGTLVGSANQPANGVAVPDRDEVRIQLNEEKLKVGKRTVEAGGVRLRKIVRTEVVHVPVKLQREEIVIERVSGEVRKEDVEIENSSQRERGTC